MGVIEALPKKKIKTEKVESGSSGLCQSVTSVASSVATTHAVSLRKSRKAVPKEPANAGGSRVTRSMKSDLPPELQDDPEDKWTNVVLPSLLMWCGDQANVWTIANSDLTCVLIAIIQHVYPVAHALPAMVFFFLFLFMPLFATFLLTVYTVLCKPGCAVSAADTSSV